MLHPENSQWSKVEQVEWGSSLNPAPPPPPPIGGWSGGAVEQAPKSEWSKSGVEQAPASPTVLTKHDEYRILTQAQADWVLREREFPKHTRQRWDDGTWLARRQAIIAAAKKLGLAP